MNFETLKTQWAAQDKKLEASLQISRTLRRESGLNKTNSALQRMSRGIVAELIINLVAIVLLIAFIGDHLSQPLFLAPAVVLHVAALLHVAFDVYQLVMLRDLDLSGPVVTAQHKLAKLRVQRIQVTKWTFWTAPLLWVPLLVVSFKGLLGVNVYIAFSSLWLLANVLFGVAVIPLMIWVSKRYADRMNRSPRMQRLMDDIAGNDLNAAAAFVDDLARFEKEPI